VEAKAREVKIAEVEEGKGKGRKGIENRGEKKKKT